jgi:hypothetical protein
MPIDNNLPRFIEVVFPLKQASLDSVHEKNVRHGHISTLHVWPARRPSLVAVLNHLQTLYTLINVSALPPTSPWSGQRGYDGIAGCTDYSCSSQFSAKFG